MKSAEVSFLFNAVNTIDLCMRIPILAKVIESITVSEGTQASAPVIVGSIQMTTHSKSRGLKKNGRAGNVYSRSFLLIWGANNPIWSQVILMDGNHHVAEISLRCRSGRWHHGFGFLHPIHGCRCCEFRLAGESSMYVQLGERTSLQPVGWVKGSCFSRGNVICWVMLLLAVIGLLQSLGNSGVWHMFGWVYWMSGVQLSNGFREASHFDQYFSTGLKPPTGWLVW